MVTTAQKRRLFRDLDRRDPDFIKKIEPFLKGLYDHYFRCEVHGWENVPPDSSEKVLFVGNHNGMITFEVVMLFYAWYQRYGLERRALGLAHSVALDNPAFRWLCPRIGAVPADPDVAHEALQRGYSLLVYPGGEKESFRPYSKRKKVDFFQRKGFVRLALKENVPIVPIASIGAHESYIIVHQGEELAKKLGLYDKFRLHGLPITYRSLFFFWCVATGVFTFFPLLLAPAAFASIFVPMPAKMTFRILPKVDVPAIAAAARAEGKSEEAIQQLVYDRVVSELQAAVEAEYRQRKFPVIG